MINMLLAWLRSQLTVLSRWFAPLDNDFPADEAGELGRHHLLQNNWFDKLTSWWVEKPILEKMAYLAGVTLLSALVGVVVGAAVVFMLATVIFSLLIHNLFFAHEQHRYLRARIYAAEAIANEDLSASEQFFNRAASQIDSVVRELGDQPRILGEQAIQLDLEGKIIATQNQQLSTLIEETQEQTAHLAEQQRDVSQRLSAISLNLEAHEQQVARSKDKIFAVAGSAVTFSNSAQELQQSQKKFSQAVNRFSHFVSERTVIRDEVRPEVARVDQDYLGFLDREIAENDALIERLSPVPGR